MSRTRLPTIASPSLTGNSTTSAPRARIDPTSAIGRGSAGLGVVSPNARASGSKVAPCTSVEVTTTKKAMLKNRLPPGRPSITG